MQQEETQEIHQTILKTQAMLFALESLCLAVFELSENKDEILERFQFHKNALTDRFLHSSEHTDKVFEYFDAAHVGILKVLLQLRDLP
jgi:hypothetical protein